MGCDYPTASGGLIDREWVGRYNFPMMQALPRWMEKGGLIASLLCGLVLILLVILAAGCRSESATITLTVDSPSRQVASKVVILTTSRPTPTLTPTPSLTPDRPADTRAPVRVTQAASSRPSKTGTAEVQPGSQIYLPSLPQEEEPTATVTPRVAPSITPTPTPTPYPTLDFRALREEVEASGQALAVSKIGFHVSVGGNQTGLGVWMRRLDEVGVPFFLKSVDYAGPLYEAQQLVQASGVPHVLVYRSTGDVPDYSLPPAEAAQQHWEYHRDRFPAELDRNLVWLETVNEVDKNRSEWLAQFALETAQRALAEGFRWAAFGWSGGEPEIADWSGPVMLSFLRLVAQQPERLAIALHEYSGTVENIAFEYPYRVGHFLHLFQVCDQYGIPRPTVLITEWGWAYDQVPTPGAVVADLAWASALYAPFPEVKGAAIWHLGGGEAFGSIADQAQQLIAPVTRYSLTHYFAVPAAPARAAADPALYGP